MNGRSAKYYRAVESGSLTKLLQWGTFAFPDGVRFPTFHADLHEGWPRSRLIERRKASRGDQHEHGSVHARIDIISAFPFLETNETCQSYRPPTLLLLHSYAPMTDGFSPSGRETSRRSVADIHSESETHDGLGKSSSGGETGGRRYSPAARCCTEMNDHAVDSRAFIDNCYRGVLTVERSPWEGALGFPTRPGSGGAAARREISPAARRAGDLKSRRTALGVINVIYMLSYFT